MKTATLTLRCIGQLDDIESKEIELPENWDLMSKSEKMTYLDDKSEEFIAEAIIVHAEENIKEC